MIRKFEYDGLLGSHIPLSGRSTEYFGFAGGMLSYNINKFRRNSPSGYTSKDEERNRPRLLEIHNLIHVF